jgi:hypothetical protein
MTREELIGHLRDVRARAESGVLYHSERDVVIALEMLAELEHKLWNAADFTLEIPIT